MIDGYLAQQFGGEGLSRRSFFRGAAAGGAAMALTNVPGLAAAQERRPQITSGGAYPDFVDGIRYSDTNWVTSGFNDLVRANVEIQDLETLAGQVPADLNGTLYRCGPEPQYPSLSGTDEYFNGEGMVHMFRFENGHVDYRSRYVENERYLAQKQARRSLFGVYRNRYTNAPEAAGVNPGTANTHVMWHAGKLLALKEDDLPYELDPDTLETVGRYDYDGAVRAQWLTAHPKIDMATNEMFTFSYQANGDGTKDLAYYVIDDRGRVAHEVWFETPFAANVHDYVMTEDYVIFPFAPLITEMDVIRSGGPFYRWHHDKQFYFAILPKYGSASDVRWFRGPPGFAAHLMNGYNDGRIVHVDADLSGAAWASFPTHDGTRLPRELYQNTLSRLTFDMGSNRDSFEITPIVPGYNCGMSRCDERFVGRRYSNGYTMISSRDGNRLTGVEPSQRGIGRVDPESGDVDLFDPGPNRGVQEPVFAERHTNSGDGDGYVMTLVNNLEEYRSELAILDGRNLSAGPIAVLKVPLRLRTTFHGLWVPAKTLQTGLYEFDPTVARVA